MQLDGNIVSLQLIQEQHVTDLYQIVKSNPAIWTHMTSNLESEEDMHKLVIHALKEHQCGKEIPFVVWHKELNRIVGSTRLYNIKPEARTCELGFTYYATEVQRTAVNTECKLLLLQHVFETLNMIRVQITTDILNLKSQKAIERIGGTREGVLRNDRQLPNGRIRDAAIYSILDREWDTVKEKLHTMLHAY
ncbi:GNAT family N-acetyltransferase [Baia soyae]|uniref:GNAT family N-acetyltransferase n=1 Tax=Baia soyae TaxID=1544746 RepID=UPI0010458558|nr:GNAT family protein [Baia soyae]